MTDDTRVGDLRHALANPLSGILAETQLMLMSDALLDDETRAGLQEIERCALRMKAILKEIQMITPPPARSTTEESR